jgi:RNA polymerase sigma factor (sigma-70 family)
LKQNLEVNKLVEHFFRHESAKMVAVLTKIFGGENLDLAEDIVQDSLVEAISRWQYAGIPNNPSAWLFRVARNKALNIMNREKYKRKYLKEASHLLQSACTDDTGLNDSFSEEQIQDDQLRMIFTCCHPSITPDSQIALALKTLCGFSIPEIARAFLTTEENVNKRLVRARQRIREDKIPFELPKGNELEKRLKAVLNTIYLLFNEGYSASRGLLVVRYELCEEAMRLIEMIATSRDIETKSGVFALQALMQLNASRFKARQDADGNIFTLEEQNRSLWDYTLMRKGFESLEKSTTDGQLSIFHILATISAYHCAVSRYEDTDWKAILALYDLLVQLDNSPVILLNRAIALSKIKGAESGITELDKLAGSPRLKSYHLYYSTLGAFYMELNQFKDAIPVFEKAIQLAQLPAEKSLLQKKLGICFEKIG